MQIKNHLKTAGPRIPRGEGLQYHERGGMLVVSLRGVNFGFWSHLVCFGQNAIICSREGLIYGCARRNIKMYIYTFIFLHAGESIR